MVADFALCIVLCSSKDGSTNEHVTSCRVQMQTIVFHRGGFYFAKFISGRFESLRIHTRIHLHGKKGGDRCSVQILTIGEVTEYVLTHPKKR